MQFHKFVQRLYSVISFGENTVRFTKTILEAVVIEEHLDILDYSDSSYKKFYNGSSSIHKLATRIAAYIDPMLFTEYLNSLNLDDAPVEKICELFSDVCPNIDAHNAREELGKLLFKIIIEAAGTNKKSAPADAFEKFIKTYNELKEAPSFNSDNYVSTVKRMYENASLNDDPVLLVKELFKKYLKRAQAFYSKRKTLIYPEKPVPFYDIYVCNDLKPHDSRSKYFDDSDRICNATLQRLEEESGYVIVEGTGGSGKSMFLTHLFLSSAEELFQNTFDKFPVFVSLKDYRASMGNMTEAIWSVVSSFIQDAKRKFILEALENKKIVLLLDGFDEIATSARTAFDKCLESFIKAYPGNTIIMTSRPINSFVSYTAFTLLDIQPLTKEQSLELIDKLKWNEDTKKEFKTKLAGSLYEDHKEFASNPLLLTIMLMTFNAYAEIPAKMHVFYAKAYETMSRLHDATKGTYVRPLHTRLTPEDFAKFFSAFCALTYEDECYTFTEKSFSHFMDEAIKCVNIDTKAKARDFLLDVTQNLCIMYREGDNYGFIHRSFQEYFTAVYLTSGYDSNLKEVGEYFEEVNGGRNYGDKTFDMLYDMIPDKVERFIFLPFLEEKFSKWNDSDPDEVYWNYLEDLFSSIYIEQGRTDCDSPTEAQSFLYQFIVRTKKIESKTSINDLQWPFEVVAFTYIEWVEAYSEFTDDSGFKKYPDPDYIPNEVLKHGALVEKESLPLEYEDYFGEPEVEGRTIEIEISEFRKKATKYPNIKTFITSHDFPLREEYERLKKYYENLKNSSLKRKKHGRLFGR